MFSMKTHHFLFRIWLLWEVIDVFQGKLIIFSIMSDYYEEWLMFFTKTHHFLFKIWLLWEIIDAFQGKLIILYKILLQYTQIVKIFTC